MHISSRIVKRTFSVRIPVATGLLLVMVSGCQPNPQSQTAADSAAELPSMSRYTSERMSGQTVGGLSGAGESAASSSERLSPGEYCFHKAGDENWLSIRLQLDDNQQLIGEASGTVIHPEKGEVLYQQDFTGELAGNDAVVEVTTHLAETSRSRMESWTVNQKNLDMGRIAIAPIDCADIASRF